MTSTPQFRPAPFDRGEDVFPNFASFERWTERFRQSVKTDFARFARARAALPRAAPRRLSGIPRP